MSEYLEKIVYLSQADYNTLLNGNSVTRNGITLSGLDDNYLYITDGTISATDIGGILPISKGGTNANNVEDARTNLGLGDAALKSVTSTISTSTSLPTAAAVKTYVDSVNVLNVRQEYHAYSGYTYWRPLVIGNSANSTDSAAPSTSEGVVHTFSNLLVQPSTGTLKATLFKGSGASLTNLNASNVTSGTLEVARGGTGTATANANTVFAGPSSGSAAAPSFRALAAADIPSITLAKISDKGDAAGYGVTDNSANADVTSSDTNLITARTLYYQLAKKGYTTNTGTVTSVGTGAGLTGGAITGSGTIKANLTSDTQLAGAALSVTEDANRIYPVRVDKNGKLVVVVPWTNTNSGYIAATGAAGDILYWSAADTPAHLTKGTNGQFLKLASGVPSWASITASDVSGLGTMATASTDSYIPKSAYTEGYQIMYSTGSGAYALLTANKSTTKKFLTMTGVSSSAGAAPTWSTLDASDIPNLNWSKITAGKPTTLSGYGITDAASSTHIQAVDKGGTGLQSYTVGDILYASGSTELTALNGNTTTTAKFLKSVGSSNAATAPTWSTIGKSDVGLGNVDNKSSATIRSEITSSNVTTALGFTPLNAALKGANSGVAELDASGKVPSSQLPAYVDDVLEYTTDDFPTTGETGIIYVNTTTNKTYRWSGTQMVEISPSLALGTTSSTAFRGDYGQTAYTHAVTNKGSAFSSGLYKITTNSEGHVTAATAVTASDIPSLSGTYKTRQTAVSDPTAHNTTTATSFIDTISQDANGVITATKKNITSATTSAKGIVQLSSTSSTTEETMAATPKGVWDAINTLDVSAVGSAGKYIQAISEADGKISATAGSTTYGSLHNPVYIDSGMFTQASGQTIEFIRSTQTGTTASWTGNTTDTALYDGKIIVYRLGQTSASTVTLNLTFPDGTKSGAKPVYRYGESTRIGTHFASGSMIFMVYDGNNSRWNCSAYYDSNSYVTQTASTLAENKWRGVLSTYNSALSGADITSGTSNVSYYSQKVRIQPYNGYLSATEFFGSGASLTNLNGSNISSGVIATTVGGTGLTSYTLGDILYASAADTLSTLAGNTTSTVKYLKSVGSSSAATAPVWAQIAASEISGLGTMATETASNYILKSTLSGAYDIMYSSAANTPTRLAANTTTTRKYLSMLGTGSAGAAPSWEAITYSTVGAAASSHTHGNIQNGGTLQTTDVTIGSGDKLVITDSSDSNKVARASLAFSASVSSQSQTTKFLREDGTWQAPSYTTNTNNAATHTLATTTKYYVTGTTSATTSTAGDSFDTGVFVTTTAGELSSVRYAYNVSGTGKAYTTYNTTDDCIDFIFV